MMTPIANAPHDFGTEAEARNWAVNNHDELRYHRKFIVPPVHYLVLANQPIFRLPCLLPNGCCGCWAKEYPL